MLEPSLVITSLASALKIVETFTSQYKSTLQRDDAATPAEPATAEVKEDELIIEKEGQVVEKITTHDFRTTDEKTKRLITVLESSMNQHFERWKTTYAKSGAADEPDISDTYRAKLTAIAKLMCSDFQLLSGYMHKVGKPLDRHYDDILFICSQPISSDSRPVWRRAIMSNKVKILLAILTLLGLLIPAYWQFVYKPNHETAAVDYAGRVLDEVTGKPIPQAKVSLEIDQTTPPILYTDTEGIFHFKVAGSPSVVRVRVDVSDYEPFDRNISLNRSGLEDIRLKPKVNESSKPGPFGFRYPQNPALEQIRQDLQAARHVTISYRQCPRSIGKTTVQLNGAQINALDVKGYLEQVAPRTNVRFFVKVISEGAAYEIVCQ